MNVQLLQHENFCVRISWSGLSIQTIVETPLPWYRIGFGPPASLCRKREEAKGDRHRSDQKRQKWQNGCQKVTETEERDLSLFASPFCSTFSARKREKSEKCRLWLTLFFPIFWGSRNLYFSPSSSFCFGPLAPNLLCRRPTGPRKKMLLHLLQCRCSGLVLESSSAKWLFSLRMIWGFGGPGFQTSWQSSVRPKTLLRCLEKWSRKRRDASPQSTCRAERNPGPRKPQIRNVQIRNLVVLDWGNPWVGDRVAILSCFIKHFQWGEA